MDPARPAARAPEAIVLAGEHPLRAVALDAAVSEFVEASVRAAVLRSRHRSDFIARGLRSLDGARRTGDYVDADVVVQTLQLKLDAARKRKPAPRR